MFFTTLLGKKHRTKHFLKISPSKKQEERGCCFVLYEGGGVYANFLEGVMGGGGSYLVFMASIGGRKTTLQNTLCSKPIIFSHFIIIFPFYPLSILFPIIFSHFIIKYFYIIIFFILLILFLFFSHFIKLLLFCIAINCMHN